MGLGRRARHISGGLGPDDYPPRAFNARATGVVHLRFTVTPRGRVENCIVTRSSGHRDLDTTTCRLIERRFRYRPARDGSGRPVEQSVTSSFDWTIPVRRAGL
jgi:protein TonB